MACTTRSKEAPMDFEFTNRRSTTPPWKQGLGKRPHDSLQPPSTPFGAPITPTFGGNVHAPFLFHQSATPQKPQPPWSPPPLFSAEKAFPAHSPQDEPKDVDMSEASPNKVDEPKENGGRKFALGGVRRAWNSRQKTRDPRSPRNHRTDDEEDDPDISDSDENERRIAPRRTSNHYTLNMAPHPPPPSDLPYILSGYLQFGFNLSLILLFLYLVIQFILTVQRDVEQRISEYSMDIVQDIAICALQYKTNLCATSPIPAMVQQCSNWETCMSRDPAVVGRAKVGAELIAEVINNFVEPISWKTLIFTLTSLAFFTFFINSLLSVFRARHLPHQPAPPPQHFPSYPPQFNPYGSLAPNLIEERARNKPGLDGEDSSAPSRRRRLENGGAVKVK